MMSLKEKIGLKEKIEMVFADIILWAIFIPIFIIKFTLFSPIIFVYSFIKRMTISIGKYIN